MPTSLRPVLVLLLALAATAPAVAFAQDPYAAPRRDMVEQIRAVALTAAGDTGRPAIADRVLAAMDKVPRHRYVPPTEVDAAYANRPPPIGHGQTISQLYLVALMTDLIDPRPDAVVLEIGTGSAYQAAILAELVHTVCTIEIIPPLAKQAETRLRSEGYTWVRTRIGDGYFGWEDCGPFDAILVTADPPPPLLWRAGAQLTFAHCGHRPRVGVALGKLAPTPAHREPPARRSSQGHPRAGQNGPAVTLHHPASPPARSRRPVIT